MGRRRPQQWLHRPLKPPRRLHPPSAGVLQLQMLGETVDCPSGKTIDLAQVLPSKFKQGSVGPCPDNNATCGSLACGPSCAVGGVCRGGDCFCNLQFTGARGAGGV